MGQKVHPTSFRLGVIKDWDLSEAPQLWKDFPEEKKAWEIRCMEVYAAMIDNMDQGIGRLVKSLKENGQYENTLILFFQDNGGCHEGRGRRPRKDAVTGVVPMGKDELQTRMQPAVTRDGRPVRTGYGVMPGPDDTYIAYGKGWANASNTPFRLYKHWVHEGGIGTPLVVHWPARVRAKGKLRSQPGHLIDIMATSVDVAGAKYPGEYKGNKIIGMQGRSLVPAFDNKPIQRDEGLFWEHEGNRAVRKGDWKLVSRYPGKWELYNLKADRTEMNDLFEKRPEIAKELMKMYNDWAKRSFVIPWGELTGRKKKEK